MKTERLLKMLLICCFSMSILLGCTTKELIPDKYRENPDYFCAIGTGIDEAEAFNNALIQINLKISGLIFSHIASLGKMQIEEKQHLNNYNYRSKYVRKIATFTKTTLIALNPVRKIPRKKDNGLIEMGVVIYFPYSRIKKEAAAIMEKQNIIKKEIQDVLNISFKDINCSFNQYMISLLDAYGLAQNLIFDDIYIERIKNRIFYTLNNLIYKIECNPDTTILLTVLYKDNSSLYPVANENFVIRLTCDGNNILKYINTDSNGTFKLKASDLICCEDSLYIYPSLTMTYLKSSKIFPDTIITKMLPKKLLWNIWKSGKVRLKSTSIKDVVWSDQSLMGIVFYGHYPGDMRFNFNVEEIGGVDVYLQQLKIKIVGDMKDGQTPKYLITSKLTSEINLKKLSETEFVWDATPRFLKIIRYLFKKDFINIKIYFQVLGKDRKGNQIESDVATITLNEKNFRPP